MAAPLKMLTASVIAQANPKLTGSIIFLHGSGDTGFGVREWVSDILNDTFAFSHIRVVFPTAPPREYRPMLGAVTTVWFDREKISNTVPDDPQSIRESSTLLTQLIESEVKTGIPKHRIILGGFSMGGSMAMHLAYGSHPDVAGVFALSSFLSKASAVYGSAAQNNVNPPLFQAHGLSDPLVLFDWGKETNDQMQKLGVENVLHTFPRLAHAMSAKELKLLKSWILSKLPDE
ncbi:PREDICTED: lysophospholipase-like protein 1 [Priapulus caudatus]|uniref:palmitoyl-protein hydrolase n=1 Tax=Priapulus caudatus TaxID=37621 RepID=A0ABM1ECM6_PRICU|nr:PREDICTED: lysophospholipase-like protein 1 [Priapulus caudatus]